MEITQLIMFMLYLITLGQCQMEPYIIKGEDASIKQFPHSALLYIKCVTNNGTSGVFMCGSSIVNQYLTLTAAHCTYNCIQDTSIIVFVGHATWSQGAASTVHGFLEHENYVDANASNDICLVRLNTPLQFNQNVGRVALMANPPYTQLASIAGWGHTGTNTTDKLQSLQSLHVQRMDDTKSLIYTEHTLSYPYKGDSGSALVVGNFIQIGLVSLGVFSHTPVKILYTDTGYFYKWIKEKSSDLMCFDGGPNNKKHNTEDSNKCTIARKQDLDDDKNKKKNLHQGLLPL